MANIRYVIKDPSFKYFIIGLLAFLAITGGGIALVKSMINKNNHQETEKLTQTTDNKPKPQELVIVDDSSKKTLDAKVEKPTATKPTEETSNPAGAHQVPTEISRTGNDSLWQIVGLSGLTYVLVLFLQETRK